MAVDYQPAVTIRSLRISPAPPTYPERLSGALFMRNPSFTQPYVFKNHFSAIWQSLRQVRYGQLRHARQPFYFVLPAAKAAAMKTEFQEG